MQHTIIDNENKEQQLAYELAANTNSSFFLTGRAGTGKTTFLNSVQQMVDKQFIVLASTGVAAILAGGDTIHSFFGLPMEVCPPNTCGKMNMEHIESVFHADTIIIDEVSMVRCDVMDAIDYTLRKVMRNNIPFGGKQMIFVGDMFQLPPVVKAGPERELLCDLYHTDEFFFYKSRAISAIRLVKIEFQKVYRQEDWQFLNVLENVRLNRMTAEDLKLLSQRVRRPEKNEHMVITLTALNKVADAINQKRLKEIDADEFTFKGIVEGKFEDKRFPAEKVLQLKVGAQVMFTRNDPHRRWANGTLGKVTQLSEESIEVTLDSGETYNVTRCTWESYSYDYNRAERKLKKKVVGTFTQFPLRLAWAITIHKSQGMTFDQLSLELSHGMFATGQLYVALSRVRSLDGLYLSKEVLPQYANTNREILNYANGYNNEKQIANEIESGKAVYRALQDNDYDEAARQYLHLTYRKAMCGDVKEALQMAKRFLDTVICDEHLYGAWDELPTAGSLNSDHWTSHFLMALCCLYARQYPLALEQINAVLDRHQCTEALYLKARALAKSGKYKEADDVNVLLADAFTFATPDAKIIYSMAVHNELHMNEPGLDIMKKLVEIKPKYDRGIVEFRKLVKKHGKSLRGAAEEPNALIEAFNSTMPEGEFADLLKEKRKSAPKDFGAFMGSIRKLVP